MGPTEDQVQELTKHEAILQAIEALQVGTKISVRSLARQLSVSEGTAYRALKEAEKTGLVSTKERIGTVRIQRKQRSQQDRLTFAEIAAILDGEVLGGAAGLQKTLQKFVIGAMELDAMLAYIDADSLLIVGNRENAHRCALEEGAGVLITGGFDTSEAIKQLADDRALPIISSRHDTYTVATMINRALYDRVIQQKIMLLEDIAPLGEALHTLRVNDTVGDFQQLQQTSGQTRFAVVDERGRLAGIMTNKDAAGAAAKQPIDKLMTRNPIRALPNLPLTSAAHLMASEGIDLLPIVDRQRKLLAVVSRQEVLGSMPFAGKQQQSGDTFDDLIWKGFTKVTGAKTGEGWLYRGRMTPQMSGPLGTVSEGVLLMLLVQGARRLIYEVGKRDPVLESITTYFVRPTQIDQELTIVPRLLEMSRKAVKLEVEVADDRGLAAKGMLTARTIDPY